MSRYDKYDGVSGGFRAVAFANQLEADYDKVLGVGLDANGLAVLKLPSVSGFKGVTIVDRTKRKAGNVLDVMTAGEIVDLTGLVAGTTYYLTSVGVLSTTESRYMVGHTVEAWRLVVRFSDQGAA